MADGVYGDDSTKEPEKSVTLGRVRCRLSWRMEPKIGPALKVIRERAGYTQRKLANELGCSHSHVVKIETGAERIDLGEFCLWCETMKIDTVEAFQEVYGSCAKE